MKASDLRAYAKKQGWHREQTENGPEIWKDENNIKRITIKKEAHERQAARLLMWKYEMLRGNE